MVTPLLHNYNCYSFVLRLRIFRKAREILSEEEDEAYLEKIKDLNKSKKTCSCRAGRVRVPYVLDRYR